MRRQAGPLTLTNQFFHPTPFHKQPKRKAQRSNQNLKVSRKLKIHKVAKNRRMSNQRNRLRVKNKLNKKAIKKVNQRLLLKEKKNLQKPSKKMSKIQKNPLVNNQKKQMKRKLQKIRNRKKILRILKMIRNNLIPKKMSRKHKIKKTKTMMEFNNYNKDQTNNKAMMMKLSMILMVTLLVNLITIAIPKI